MGEELSTVSTTVDMGGALVLWHACFLYLPKQVCQSIHAGFYITLNYIGLKSFVLDAQTSTAKKLLCRCYGQVSTRGQIRKSV